MYQEPDGIFGIIEVVRDFYDHGIDEHMIVFLLMAIVALERGPIMSFQVENGGKG